MNEETSKLLTEETPESMNEEWLPAGDHLVSFDKKLYKSRVNYWEEWCERIEKCIADFNSLDIGTFKQADLYLLFNSPETYVQVRRLQNLGDAPIIVHGVTMNKLKFIEIMEKPKGYDPFLKQVASVNEIINRYVSSERDDYNANTLKAFLRFFLFDDKGKVIIEEEIFEKIKKQCTRYIYTEKAKKSMIFGIAFAKFLSESDITNVIAKDSFAEFITSVVEYKPGSEMNKVNYDYIKKFDYEKS